MRAEQRVVYAEHFSKNEWRWCWKRVLPRRNSCLLAIVSTSWLYDGVYRVADTY